MKRLVPLALLASSLMFGGVLKVTTYPVRHHAKFFRGIGHGIKRTPHYVKVVIW